MKKKSKEEGRFDKTNVILKLFRKDKAQKHEIEHFANAKKYRFSNRCTMLYFSTFFAFPHITKSIVREF